jgi:hypothetical protein
VYERAFTHGYDMIVFIYIYIYVFVSSLVVKMINTIYTHPHMNYKVFDGEEFSRALRGWTWGYDYYTPPRTVVGHNYNRVRKGHWKMTDSKR